MLIKSKDYGGKIYSLIKKRFKAIHIFKAAKIAISADTPSVFHLHTGYRFDQIMKEHIATVQKFNVLKLTFSAEGLICSPGAYMPNMHENMTSVIGKLNFVSY